MPSPFVHFELNTPDLDRARQFYGDLFGWQFTDMPAGPGMVYSTFKPASGPGGGMMSNPAAGRGWLAYIGVNDIHAATRHAASLGAQVCTDAQEIPHVGWWSLLTDPTGATIAIFQPGPGSPPPNPQGQSPANSFVHLELNTTDLAHAKAFYGELFGWTFADHDMADGLTYSMFMPEPGPGGGMMAMPGVPVAWLAYVGVNDIHAATGKAAAGGAQVLRGPQEVPGKGFMTILLDPAGAAIALWQNA